MLLSLVEVSGILFSLLKFHNFFKYSLHTVHAGDMCAVRYYSAGELRVAGFPDERYDTICVSYNIGFSL